MNGNGEEDAGEFGAFKIMNTAGQRVLEYMTGYIWMAYDALGATSGIANTPTNRLSAMGNVVYCEDGNSDDGLPVSYNLVKIVEPMTVKTANYTGGVIQI